MTTQILSTLGSFLEFLVGWLVSSAIIFLAIKIYPGKQKRESFGGALAVALVGYVVQKALSLLGIPFATLLSLIVWLYIIGKVFEVSWLGAVVIAIIVYLLSLAVGLLGIPRLI
ncbi:MAG: hypothetical protein DRN04_02025 [Thermoprotei archaeon]|nr:MAG: hypothetical protein DRN04_02025 [Thermoprotei archaeon]